MIAAAIAASPSVLVLESRDDGKVLLELGERLHTRVKLIVSPDAGGEPVLTDHAIGGVHESHPQRIAARSGRDERRGGVRGPSQKRLEARQRQEEPGGPDEITAIHSGGFHNQEGWEGLGIMRLSGTRVHRNFLAVPASFLEGSALNHRKQEGLHAAAVRAQGVHELLHGWRVVVVEAAPDGVGEQLL